MEYRRCLGEAGWIDDVRIDFLFFFYFHVSQYFILVFILSFMFASAESNHGNLQ